DMAVRCDCMRFRFVYDTFVSIGGISRNGQIIHFSPALVLPVAPVHLKSDPLTRHTPQTRRCARRKIVSPQSLTVYRAIVTTLDVPCAGKPERSITRTSIDVPFLASWTSTGC